MSTHQYLPQYQWTGTWLSAAFLATTDIRNKWGALLNQWAESGMLECGKASLITMPPSQVTFESFQDPSYEPDIDWCSGPAGILPKLESHLFVHLFLVVTNSNALKEVRLDVNVNRDNSVTISVSAPYQEIYAEQPYDTRIASLNQFIDVCCRLFNPNLFVIGIVDEEARIDGVASLKNEQHRVADWVFYGAEMTSILKSTGYQSQAVPKEWRDLRDGGLFVRWSDWEAIHEQPPGTWQETVLSTLAKVVNFK